MPLWKATTWRKSSRRLSTAAADNAVATGRRRVTVVPRPGPLSMASVAPCGSA